MIKCNEVTKALLFSHCGASRGGAVDGRTVNGYQYFNYHLFVNVIIHATITAVLTDLIAGSY
jgi:hypothetical protein